MVGWINDHILVLSGWAAIAVVFLLPALESSIFLGFVLPGETAVVIGGVLAYQHKVSLAGVLIAAIAGAIIGDSVGFEVGRRWGDALLRRIPAKLVKPVHVAQGKETINRLGGRAVFAGRWVSVLRALVPGLCGTSNMRYGTFLTWNALGGVTWATGYTLLGYLAGSAWERVEHYSSVVSYALLGVVVVAIVVVVLWRRRSQAAKDARTESELAEESEESEESGEAEAGARAGKGSAAEGSAGSAGAAGAVGGAVGVAGAGKGAGAVVAAGTNGTAAQKTQSSVTIPESEAEVATSAESLAQPERAEDPVEPEVAARAPSQSD